MEVARKRAPVEVCMTTYNGINYVKEQVLSIVKQLKEDDCLSIVDDGSTDGTLEYLMELASLDSRINLYQHHRQGVVFNIEFLLKKAQASYIFLSDQDDIWDSDKVDIILNYFQQHPNIDVVMTDLRVINHINELMYPSFCYERQCRLGFWPNLLKNSYIGCAMAFRKEALDYILPFPKQIPMHDWWIGLIASKYAKMDILFRTTMSYRRHEDNVSEWRSTTPWSQRFLWRWYLYKGILCRGKEFKDKR